MSCSVSAVGASVGFCRVFCITRKAPEAATVKKAFNQLFHFRELNGYWISNIEQGVMKEAASPAVNGVGCARGEIMRNSLSAGAGLRWPKFIALWRRRWVCASRNCADLFRPALPTSR